jgi:hypothetical protein
MWKRYHGNVTGIKVEGDPNVPPTTRWNHLYLLLFVWKKVAVLCVIEKCDFESTEEGYCVGYITRDGHKYIQTRRVKHGSFKMRLGYEGCTFFAIDHTGREIRLELTTITHIDNPRYVELPLL